MDITSLWYFSEVAKDMHITHTAERLYISQQTLSNHIQRLEEYYGTQLLYRKPTLSLTAAGERVLEFAQNTIKNETNLKDILADIEGERRGVLRIGASIARANVCLPPVLSQFARIYPEVEIRFADGISSTLEPRVVSGELDFAMVLSGEPNPKLIAKRLLHDQIYLCVADDLLRRVYKEEASALKERAVEGVRICDFAKLPFALMSNRQGDSVRAAFDACGVTPEVVLRSTYSELLVPPCIGGTAACFMNQMSIVGMREAFPDHVNVFPVLFNEGTMTQNLALIRHRDRYLSHYMEYFIELLTHFFEDVEHVSLVRKVP